MHAIALVGKLLCAHAEVQRRFKSMAAAAEPRDYQAKR